MRRHASKSGRGRAPALVIFIVLLAVAMAFSSLVFFQFYVDRASTPHGETEDQAASTDTFEDSLIDNEIPTNSSSGVGKMNSGIASFNLTSKQEQNTSKINETSAVAIGKRVRPTASVELPPGGLCDRSMNRAVPFHWMCHPTSKAISVLGPDGKPVTVEMLGRFESSDREYVYHYEVKSSGEYTVMDGDKAIKKFRVHPESCSCPEPLPEFRKRYQCSSEDMEYLDEIMSRWLPKSVVLDEYDNVHVFGSRKSNHVRVSVINNTVHVQKLGSKKEKDAEKGKFYVKHFESFMLSLLRKVKVPDCEFYHSYAYDGPSIDSFRPSPPVLSQGYNDQYAEIPGPTTSQIRWMFNGNAVRYAAAGFKWADRKPIAFFRGSRTGKNRRRIEDLKYNDRFRLVMLARNHSSIDAKILSRFNGNDDRDTVRRIYEWAARQGLVTKQRTAEESIKEYKYVLNPDGNAASWRMHYQMAAGAVIVKQKSPWKEWWYDILLHSGVNYVETGRYFDDLHGIVDWLLEHDSAAENMARNAFLTWAQRLRAEDAYCWMAAVLEKLASKLAFEPAVRAGMEVVKERQVEKCTCQH